MCDRTRGTLADGDGEAKASSLALNIAPFQPRTGVPCRTALQRLVPSFPHEALS
jgi:hypothetical protein